MLLCVSRIQGAATANNNGTYTTISHQVRDYLADRDDCEQRQPFDKVYVLHGQQKAATIHAYYNISILNHRLNIYNIHTNRALHGECSAYTHTLHLHRAQNTVMHNNCVINTVDVCEARLYFCNLVGDERSRVTISL